MDRRKYLGIELGNTFLPNAITKAIDVTPPREDAPVESLQIPIVRKIDDTTQVEGYVVFAPASSIPLGCYNVNVHLVDKVYRHMPKHEDELLIEACRAYLEKRAIRYEIVKGCLR